MPRPIVREDRRVDPEVRGDSCAHRVLRPAIEGITRPWRRPSESVNLVVVDPQGKVTTAAGVGSRGSGMFDMFDLRDLFLAFRDWEPGESFWRTLAIYMGVTAACGVAGALAWAVWR